MQTKKGKKVVLINFLIHVICISAFIKYTDQLFGCRRVYLFSDGLILFREILMKIFFSIYLIVLADFFRYRILQSLNYLCRTNEKRSEVKISWLITPLYVNIFNKYTFNGKMYSRINFCRKEKKILKYFTQKIS